MKPDRISVSSDELVNGNPVDGRRTLDPLLLPVDEDGHVLTLPAFLLRLLGGGELAIPFSHDCDRCPLTFPAMIRLQPWNIVNGDGIVCQGPFPLSERQVLSGLEGEPASLKLVLLGV